MTDPQVEEVLEQLYMREQENRARPLTPPAEATLGAAAKAGLIRWEAGGPRLTDEGLAAGRAVVRRHRLAERLIHDVLQFEDADAENDACGFEHILRRGLDDRVCVLLGHPATCPHGYPIPRGECCLRAEREQTTEVGALCDGRAGQQGVVAYLSTRDNREIQKLMAMGILPGSDIRLIRLFPSYIFEIGHSQFTVDRTLAEKIFVHWRGHAE
jgi:DtxR family transcriptional regulator, Mn-dependent transcriptional regulator